MTGRAAGLCAGNEMAGYANAGVGRGSGRGFGPGLGRGGRRRGWRGGQRMVTPAGPYRGGLASEDPQTRMSVPQAGDAAPTRQQQIDQLQSQARYLEQSLKVLLEGIETLQSQSD